MAKNTPKSEYEMEDEEQGTPAPTPPARESASSGGSKFPASELLEKVSGITNGEVTQPVAAGALTNAGIELDQQISREEFLQAIEEFKKVKVYDA